MNIKEENYCRLCYNTVDNVLNIIEEDISNMLNFLLLGTNLNQSTNPIICPCCTEAVKRCFYFKSTCIETEGLINPFTVAKEEVDNELKGIRQGRVKLETLDDNLYTCRLCTSKLEDSDLMSLNVLLNDDTFAKMFQEFLPELDLCIPRNPLICMSCKNNLDYYFELAKNFAAAENKISTNCQDNRTFSVNNTDHLTVSDTSGHPEADIHVHTIKQEADALEAMESIQSRECGIEIKPEETLDIKDEINIDDSVAENSKDCSETEMYKCSECPYETKYKCNIKKHMIVHKTKEVKVYTCPSCTYETKYKKWLQKHTLIHNDPSGVPMYKCTKCPYETRHKHCLKKHVISHKNESELEMYSCPLCIFKSKYKKSLQNHLIIHKDPSETTVYKCATCPYKTKHKDTLRTHMITHKGASERKMFSCSLCTFETNYKASLQGHMMLHKDPSQVTSFKCTSCPYETKHKTNLRKHLITHKSPSELKMYTCTLCSYEAKHKKSLQYHIMTHKDPSEITLHKCTKCPYKTKYKADIKTHMIAHQSVSEVQMYTCSSCTFETRYKKSLQRHALIHK